MFDCACVCVCVCVMEMGSTDGYSQLEYLSCVFLQGWSTCARVHVI